MAFNFPDAPTLNQRWPDPATVGMPQYQWDGSAWKAASFDPAGYVKRSGDTMVGALSLSGDPTEALHAVPKQYLDAQKQRISLAGGKQFDVQVPTGAIAARLTGVIYPTTAAATSVYLHLSTAVGVFKGAVGDYSLNGYQHNTQTTPTAVTAIVNSLSYPGMLIASGHTNIALAIQFQGTLTLVRPTVGSRFSSDTTSIYFIASSAIHAAYQNYASFVPPELSVLAFRIISPAGDNWDTSSFLTVEWM